MTHNPTWPLNEPIETDVPDLIATVLVIDSTGAMSGYVDSLESENRYVRTWSEHGKATGGSCANLIPPKPARQYGYAVWEGSDATIFYWEARANGYSDGGFLRSNPVRFPIPRPDETLCVKPSREDVQEIVDEHFRLGTTTKIPAAIMALLDGDNDD